MYNYEILEENIRGKTMTLDLIPKTGNKSKKQNYIKIKNICASVE